MATAKRPEVTSNCSLLLAKDHRLDNIASPTAELDRPCDPGPPTLVQAALPGLAFGDEHFVEVIEGV